MAEKNSGGGGLEYLRTVNPVEAGTLEEALARARKAGEAALEAGQVLAGRQPVSPSAANYDPGDAWAGGEDWPVQEADPPAQATLLVLAPPAGMAATRRKS